MMSRAKWVEEDEKPSTYFKNVESRIYTCIKNSNG